ncbi:MAG: hypothetical protein R6T90_02965 [Dissulfuribacterales bacterium]
MQREKTDGIILAPGERAFALTRKFLKNNALPAIVGRGYNNSYIFYFTTN